VAGRAATDDDDVADGLHGILAKAGQAAAGGGLMNRRCVSRALSIV
jgi:hypothetical protein